MIGIGEFSVNPNYFSGRRRSRRRREGSDFSEPEISTEKQTFGHTVHQSFIPVFLMHPDGTLLNDQTEFILGDDCSFSWPTIGHLGACSSYPSVFNVLNHENSFFNYHSTYKEEPVSIYVHRGLIQDTYGRVLYLLTCKKGVNLVNAKPEDFKVYLSNRFFESKYTNIYKKLLKEYFQPMIEKGVNFIYTAHDIKKMYVKESIKVDGSSIQEIKESIESAKSLLIYNEHYELREEAIKRGIISDTLDLTHRSRLFVRPEDMYLYDYCAHHYEDTLDHYDTDIPDWYFSESELEEEVEPIPYESESDNINTAGNYTVDSSNIVSTSDNSSFIIVDDIGNTDSLPF